MLKAIHILFYGKVQVDNDQEKVQSERNPHSKNRSEKKLETVARFLFWYVTSGHQPIMVRINHYLGLTFTCLHANSIFITHRLFNRDNTESMKLCEYSGRGHFGRR